MANISSYNQLSSWNEDDDLLFVQQPDAPKKAHPSQMKEYILEGLDVASVGGTGKYISEISEADGKISATAETMDTAPTEGSTKAVTSGGIKTAIDDSVSLKTATGNPIVITDAANANAEELSMTIEPIQSGSGDPSPTNIRPISGISTASVETTNGEDTNTVTIALGQTVYGGSVNFKTGEVTVTHKSVTFVGADSENWIAGGSSGNEIFVIDLVDIKQSQGIADIFTGKADKSKTVSFQQLYDTTNVFCVAGSNNTNLYAKFGSNVTLADVKTWLSTNHLQLCYELATPTTLTLTPAELELLKGNNTITANGAEISIKYYPDNAIGALAGKVDDKADITYVDNAISYTDVTIYKGTSGHGTPTGSTGGAYYESLVTYDVLGVTKNKILNISIVEWNGITKPFTLYLGSSTVGVLSDSNTSIYSNDVQSQSNLILRVVYKNN